MALGQHEPVPVWPDRVAGVEAEKTLPQRIGDRGHPHRGSRVARVRLLDRVHAQCPDGVDRGGVRVLGRSSGHCSSMSGCGDESGRKQSLLLRCVQGRNSAAIFLTMPSWPIVDSGYLASLTGVRADILVTRRLLLSFHLISVNLKFAIWPGADKNIFHHKYRDARKLPLARVGAPGGLQARFRRT